MSKDAGRAYARIGPDDIEQLDVSVGDIVEIAGKRRTVCRVMPLHKEFRGRSCVQMDGVSRENAGAGLDEFTTLRKVACRKADRVTLSPVNVTPSERDLDYIGGLLDGLPVVEGDRVRATLFGSRWVDFKVQSTSPRGPVLIGPNTQLTIGEALSDKVTRSVSYEDVGGLKPQLRRIREMIELPLRHPEIFERLGIDAPKGVLLYGPPGCGKTLIARAIAHETEATFLSVSGPEVVHKFYGESEAKLRKIFEEAARKAPSIVFIDEIDAIAPRSREADRRAVARADGRPEPPPERDRDRCDQHPKRARPGAPPPRTVRSRTGDSDPGPFRPTRDGRDPQPRHAARAGRKPRTPGGHHPRLCRRRPRSAVPRSRNAHLAAPHA
jgi:transitional endoplasmic reticulum ATPase